MAYESHEPVDRRWLRVVKMRGANHLAGKHSFRISDEGCEVFPRLETIVSDDRPAPSAPGVCPAACRGSTS